MIIRPTDIHYDINRARMSAITIARDLGVECDCRLSTMWRVDIDGNELTTFLEMCREEAENGA